jgi:hypothetical protein
VRTAKPGVSWPHTLAIDAVNSTLGYGLNPMATHTAHGGNLATSARSWFKEVLESVVWADTNNADENRPAMVKKRIVKQNDQNPEAMAECNETHFGRPEQRDILRACI